MSYTVDPSMLSGLLRDQSNAQWREDPTQGLGRLRESPVKAMLEDSTYGVERRCYVLPRYFACHRIARLHATFCCTFDTH